MPGILGHTISHLLLEVIRECRSMKSSNKNLHVRMQSWIHENDFQMNMHLIFS